MTGHDDITERLSDYLDDELDPRERTEIAAHLGECGECRQVLDQLRTIATTATRLTDAPPERDLWPDIVSRLELPSATVHVFKPAPRRRFSFTLPQLAAASIALMVLSGSLVYLARSGDARADFPAMSAERIPASAVPVSFSDPNYDSAIADLEGALEEGRNKLDAETIKVLEQNLATIDVAIEQCRHALEADPANAFLTSHLASARQRKLALLRRATALTAGS